MRRLLVEKRALITGGTSGIGKEIAKLFVSEGADVAIFGTSQERGEAALQEFKAAMPSPEQRLKLELVNVGDMKAVETAIQQLNEAWGGIDILVNCAGITRDNLLLRMSEEDWDEVMRINLKSVFNTCKAAIRPMMRAKGGKIINVSSVVGITGNPGQANYAAAKAGMIGFTKALAQEVASRGIFVNCIAPGFVRTPMTDGLKDEQKESFLKKVPLARAGEPQDIAGVALFLASSMSDYMTGKVLSVDGGLVM